MLRRGCGPAAPGCPARPGGTAAGSGAGGACRSCRPGGAAYTPPGNAARRFKGSDQGYEHLYAQIPSELWTQGYMALLSGAGLAFLLILLDQRAFNTPLITALRPIWISPKALADYYAVSDDTRSKGMTDLQDLGLITISRQPINPNDFDIHRIRNAYTLNMDALKRPGRRQQR